MKPNVRALTLRDRLIALFPLPRHAATSVVSGVLIVVAARPIVRADQIGTSGAPDVPAHVTAEVDPAVADGSSRSMAATAKYNDGDPPVDIVCKAAVALALAEPDRARGFLSRARMAGWLPEMHFRAYRRFARTEGLTFADTGTGTTTPVDISSVDDVRYEWRASWDLSRMVFNPDELQAHLEALRMSDIRRDIQSLVIKLYFERRRLLVDSAPSDHGGPSDPPGSEKRFLRIAEIEAQLDALSGGAFSEGARTRRQAAPAP